jgi:hypothetical protein
VPPTTENEEFISLPEGACFIFCADRATNKNLTYYNQRHMKSKSGETAAFADD